MAIFLGSETTAIDGGLSNLCDCVSRLMLSLRGRRKCGGLTSSALFQSRLSGWTKRQVGFLGQPLPPSRGNPCGS